MTHLRRLLASFAAAALLGCASAGGNTAPGVTRSGGIEIDRTGSDIARFDSLPRDYASPPVLSSVPMPPMPVPSSLAGTQRDFVLSLDERGVITRISLLPMADRAYERQVIATLRQYKFREAKRADGRGTKSYYKTTIQFAGPPR